MYHYKCWFLYPITSLNLLISTNMCVWSSGFCSYKVMLLSVLLTLPSSLLPFSSFFSSFQHSIRETAQSERPFLVPDHKVKCSKLCAFENNIMTSPYMILIILRYSSSQLNFERFISIMNTCWVCPIPFWHLLGDMVYVCLVLMRCIPFTVL